MILLLIACIVGTTLGQDQKFPFQTEAEAENFFSINFDHVDGNQNGYLEIHELRGIYIFEDANGDGKLTLEEYQQVLPIPHAMAEQAFHYYDFTGKGYIAIDEMYDWYGSMDGNDDGLISKQEYLKYELETFRRIYGPIGGTGTGTE